MIYVKQLKEKKKIHDRVTGRALQRMRLRIMQEQPLCVICEEKGLIVLGAEMDHIVPLFKGGSNLDENLQMLCIECHLKKTADDLGVRYRIATGLDGWPQENSGGGGGKNLGDDLGEIVFTPSF